MLRPPSLRVAHTLLLICPEGDTKHWQTIMLGLEGARSLPAACFQLQCGLKHTSTGFLLVHTGFSSRNLLFPGLLGVILISARTQNSVSVWGVQVYIDIQLQGRAREAVTGHWGRLEAGRARANCWLAASQTACEAHDQMGVWVGFEGFSGARLYGQSVRAGRDCVKGRGLSYHRQAACAWLAVFHSHPASHAPSCSRLSRARFVISDFQRAFAEKEPASTHMRFFLSSNSSFFGFQVPRSHAAGGLFCKAALTLWPIAASQLLEHQ